MDLVISRPEGLYCPPGDFYIDPWRKVDRALITHAHADHARFGHNHYMCAAEGELVLKTRLGNIQVQAVPYGQPVEHNGVTISFHPAGHVLGSAQIRLAYKGQIWVVSGDYKVMPDLTCTAFEPVKCHTFITESTFGMPIYRWQPDEVIYREINQWWAENAAQGKASVLYGYSFGKAQRLIAGVDKGIGPIVCHSAAQALNNAYRECGVALPDTFMVSEVEDKSVFSRCLAIAPPAAQGATWMKRFGKQYSDAFASGWMALRGARRRSGVDRGFVMSDHADWPGLQRAIGATQAEQVIVTHGAVDTLVRWLREQGLEARAFRTEYGDDAFEAAIETADDNVHIVASEKAVEPTSHYGSAPATGLAP